MSKDTFEKYLRYLVRRSMKKHYTMQQEEDQQRDVLLGFLSRPESDNDSNSGGNQGKSQIIQSHLNKKQQQNEKILVEESQKERVQKKDTVKSSNKEMINKDNGKGKTKGNVKYNPKTKSLGTMKDINPQQTVENLGTIVPEKSDQDNILDTIDVHDADFSDNSDGGYDKKKSRASRKRY